jgi:hypothetical protein
MLFHPDDQTGIGHANTLKLFESDNSGGYTTTIKNPLQFELVIDHLSSGLSFRQVVAVYNSTKKRTGLSKLGNISEGTVSNYARIAVAINLQRIADILADESIWAFSLANDSSTHHGRSYFDNRIRFHRDGILHNVHIMAVPMYDNHTGKLMFDLITKLLTAMYPEWKKKLLGISTDGASSMTGSVRGLATRLEAVVEHKLYRIWCGLHQLDLIMKYGYKELMDGEFNDILHKLTGHLRHQSNLINGMRAKCPKATITRWTAMGTTCQWLMENRVVILQYLTTNDAEQAPHDWWWVVAAVLSQLSVQVNIAVIKLQARDLLMSQQAQELDHLAGIFINHFMIEGPNPITPDEIDKSINCMYGRWTVTHENIINFILDQGLFIQEIFLEKLSIELRIKIIVMIGQLILQIVDGITDISVERTSTNRSSDDELPATLPHELVKLRGRDFTTLLARHLNHLKQIWTEESIAELEHQHRQLLVMYEHDATLKSILGRCDGNTSFEEGWAIVEGQKLDRLRDFCGGLASIFPNTASVESDFSILGWEMDSHRMSLMDVSVEGIMQCGQWEILVNLIK